MGGDRADHPSSTFAAPFISARDFLLGCREDYATAYRDFQWPKLDQFNWALDYFDAMARDNAQPALWLVDEDGGETKLSFAALGVHAGGYEARRGYHSGDHIIDPQ